MESSAFQKVILVADDEPAVALALEEYFRLRGYEVAKAFDGDQALEQVKIKRPALVVLDLRMPRMDGISVLQAIRSDYPETRVLVMTGQADHYRKDLERLRPEKVLVKPVSLEELTRSVELLLKEKTAAPTPGKRKAASAGKVKLLVVEGSALVYEQVLQPYFESTERGAGYETALAATPEQALRKIEEFRPQVVVLDATRMPVGVNAGRLAADLSAVNPRPAEVILYSLQVPQRSTEPLEQLEKAIQRAIHAT